ncbi:MULTISPECIES: helix-turn-helix transcriptional regulator [unclassified Caulobacter]|jgi:transcriptional regulator with XRE-family HTH domain|uniref:helix-turn-helix domain-containing protein n=1 Tax=unclassified Caulobacter TaxID=2648921 RepID=UPI0009E69E6B|nr:MULTISPECIES: helix-turn-helix transcriptional regulator [unclassified Caulobacter]MBQ1563590.1 helix-turn-helix transcriptional regulator [Caulobacter sp.]PIB96232.1 XRE family transcriptional regulator [Caulobacter sp. X]
MDFLAVVGANVRTLREARGLPQDELAHLAGIHPTYLSGVETGKRNLSMKVLERLASALRVPETDLVIRR